MLQYDLGKGAKENWLVAETAFEPDHQGKCEAIFCAGNGYLGQRAAFEERYVGQTRDLMVTGTFNKFDEDEVTELPNLPDVTNLEFRVDGVRFAMDAANTKDYLRVMDFQTGECKRTLTWTHPDGRRFALCFTRFASMDNEHVLGLRASITALDGGAEIRVDSGIDGRVSNTGSQHFHEGDKRIFDNRVLRMVSRTIQSGVSCCLHTAHTFTVNGQEAQGKLLPIIDRRYMAMRATFTLEKGQTLTVDKLTVVTTSRDLAYENLENKAERAQEDGGRMMQQAIEAGYDALFAASCAKWAELWDKADVRITSKRPFDQLMVRFALYHLNIMAKKDDNRVGIGAKGMTGEGYKGHSFWDTEMFLMPHYLFTDPAAALAYLKGANYPTVIKADGLALGKGAVIVNSFEEAEKTVNEMMVERVFGASGDRILVEEFLTGPEVSVLSFTDGKTVVPMVSSMDHKRAKDNDEGLNTGGMGTVAPNPYYTEEIAGTCMETIFLPTIRAMNAEGRTFRGCLYFGLMLTKDGPKVIEYNCRFGDPETQVVLPLLRSDLLEIMLAVRGGCLREDMVRFRKGAACCVVLASEGYPKKYDTGFAVSLPETGPDEDIYIAGAKLENGKLVTSGGRVLGAVATADSLKEAVGRAYALADKIHFENAYMRRDIGKRALAALEDR